MFPNARSAPLLSLALAAALAATVIAAAPGRAASFFVSGLASGLAQGQDADALTRQRFEALGRALVLGAREPADLRAGQQKSPPKRSFVALFQAIARGDLAGARRCAPPRGTVDALDTKTGATPLTWAAQCGKADAAAWLLSLGADVELADGQKAT
ncbi:MAG: hypothetical protein AB7D51_00175, partial [Desulfovibrionaceae bacterium]